MATTRLSSTRVSSREAIELDDGDDNDLRLVPASPPWMRRLRLLSPIFVLTAVMLMAFLVMQFSMSSSPGPLRPPPAAPAAPPPLMFQPPTASPPTSPANPRPPAPPRPPLSAVNTWDDYGAPMPLLTADERLYFVEENEALTINVRAQLLNLITDEPRLAAALSAANSAAQNVSQLDAIAAELCGTIAAAIPFIGFNGISNIMASVVCCPLTERSRGMPVLIDGVAAYDWLHAVGAFGTANALSPAPSSAGAGAPLALRLRSTLAMALRANWPGSDQPQEAPIHAYVWQYMITRLRQGAGQGAVWNTTRFWDVGFEVCGTSLNEWYFVHCMHGLSHAMGRYVMVADWGTGAGAPWAREGVPLSTPPSPSARTGIQCRSAHRTANLSRATLERALELCSSAPSAGLALYLALGVWMDYFEQSHAMPDAYADVAVDAPAWLTITGVSILGPYVVRAPCDQQWANYSGSCFARFFNIRDTLGLGNAPPPPPGTTQPTVSTEWEDASLSPLDASRSNLSAAAYRLFTSSDQRDIRRCLADPMADEHNRRGCIFGLALNKYPDGQIWHAPASIFESRRTLVAYCGIFVDLHSAIDAGTHEREHQRLLACVSGSMIGIGYGTVADRRVPSWLVEVHCGQLVDAPELAWLDVAERQHAAHICYEAGTLCTFANACSEPADVLSLYGMALSS